MLCIYYVRSLTFCSDLCAPNFCTTQSQISCTGCSANWILGATCTLDPASGYQLVVKSSDMLASTSNLQMLPISSLFNCGVYNYYGNYDCSTTLQLSMPSGISLPHFAFQVIVWVFLYDDTTWATSNNIRVSFSSTTVSRMMGSFDGQ